MRATAHPAEVVGTPVRDFFVFPLMSLLFCIKKGLELCFRKKHRFPGAHGEPRGSRGAEHPPSFLHAAGADLLYWGAASVDDPRSTKQVDQVWLCQLWPYDAS